jgi:hypothetical protein
MTLSPDGKWLWTGNAWVPAPPVVAPPSPVMIPILPPPMQRIEPRVDYRIRYILCWFFGMMSIGFMRGGAKLLLPIGWFILAFLFLWLPATVIWFRIPKQERKRQNFRTDVIAGLMAVVGLVIGFWLAVAANEIAYALGAYWGL